MLPNTYTLQLMTDLASWQRAIIGSITQSELSISVWILFFWDDSRGYEQSSEIWAAGSVLCSHGKCCANSFLWRWLVFLHCQHTDHLFLQCSAGGDNVFIGFFFLLAGDLAAAFAACSLKAWLRSLVRNLLLPMSRCCISYWPFTPLMRAWATSLWMKFADDLKGAWWANCLMAFTNSCSGSQFNWILSLSWNMYTAASWWSLQWSYRVQTSSYATLAGILCRISAAWPCSMLSRCMALLWDSESLWLAMVLK